VTEVGYVNGTFGPLSEMTISINDRGFLFGDGVYEVLRGYDGRLWATERHWQRLANSLAAIWIEGVDLEALLRIVREAVRRAGTANPLVYIQITRGIAPRNHDWDRQRLDPTVVVTVREAKEPSAEQRRDGVRCVTLPDLRWKHCDIKSLNLLPNVMAKQLAHEAGAYEAVLVDADGLVTEGSSSTLLAVSDGVIHCPPQTGAVLPSISRDLVLEFAAELGIEVRREPFSLEFLRAADEAMLCGTTSEVIGVTLLDDGAIGDGQVGPLTRQLAGAYRKAVVAGRDGLRVGEGDRR